MKHSIFIFLTLLTSWSLFGQSFPPAASPDHVPIVGTNLSLVPPPGFLPSENFKGFQDPDVPTAMIMVMEIPGPYYEIIKGFETDGMEERGMQLIAKEETSIAGYDALLLQIEQRASGLDFAKHILVYGDSSSATMINATYLKEADKLGKQLRKSLQTTYVDRSATTNPRAELGYTLDESVGGLKFLSVMGNATLFNRDGKIPTESDDQVTLIVDRSYAQVEIADKKVFPITRLTQLPGGYIPRSAPESISIDELSGFELRAGNEEKEVYEVILYPEEGGYYLFLGTYAVGRDAALADIQRVVRTFRQKR